MTPQQAKLLRQIVEANGAAPDRFGRVIAAGEIVMTSVNPSPILYLVAHGFVAGAGGRIVATEAGRRVAAVPAR